MNKGKNLVVKNTHIGKARVLILRTKKDFYSSIFISSGTFIRHYKFIDPMCFVQAVNCN